MRQVISSPPQADSGTSSRTSKLTSRVRDALPSATDSGVALLSAVLLILSFPNFELWPLAWFALVPVLLIVARTPMPLRSFFLWWLFGSVFFYGSCYWLTYSMIRFGGIPTVFAYLLLIPGALVMGVFPGLFATAIARAVRKWGASALFLAPPFWAALEWARLGITGQLWNAIGYSPAFHPELIQTAKWGGVYLVGFLIVSINASLALVLLRRSATGLVCAVAAVAVTGFVIVAAHQSSPHGPSSPIQKTDPIVIAIQPNVPMDLVKSVADMRMLATRHFEMSQAELVKLPNDGRPRLVIWPESPMNFGYGGDAFLRERLATFAKTHRTSILLNSQEVAPNEGIYNSAVLINEQGSLITQYDKIRLLPFGEYVPLPSWAPGAGLIRGIVGDFTPGSNYRLMPVGDVHAGVFICIESAYPSIARSFTAEGANALINISNDGYLGPTAVMRQHLSNAVFRAVENRRPVLRVTNTGITAFITLTGAVNDATTPFRQDVRTWSLVGRLSSDKTFYVAHGDLFAGICSILSLLVFALSFRHSRKV